MDWLLNWLRGPAPGDSALTRLLELAWYDGLRTGLVCGLAGGTVLGCFLVYMIARIATEDRHS